jgi:hypothetical protein
VTTIDELTPEDLDEVLGVNVAGMPGLITDAASPIAAVPRVSAPVPCPLVGVM